jgi:hypothetical protein
LSFEIWISFDIWALSFGFSSLPFPLPPTLQPPTFLGPHGEILRKYEIFKEILRFSGFFCFLFCNDFLEIEFLTQNLRDNIGEVAKKWPKII